TGESFVYATFLGSGYDDYGTGIALDSDGNAYVTGYTVRQGSLDLPRRTPFPATRGFQAGPETNRNSIYAFATKFSAVGRMSYSVLLGEVEFSIPSSDMDVSPEIAVDRFGQAYIAGTTRSFLFPITFAAYQKQIRTHMPTGSRVSGFIMSLNNQGTNLIFSTFYGG